MKAVFTPAAGSDAACGHTLALTATIDAKVNARSMEGTVSLDDCPGCSAIEFHGLREQPAKSKGGH